MEHWRTKYPELDGKAHRGTVAEHAATAWGHRSRSKHTDMPRYLENWLRREARQCHYAWKREQAETETDGDAVMRALREEYLND